MIKIFFKQNRNSVVNIEYVHQGKGKHSPIFYFPNVITQNFRHLHQPNRYLNLVNIHLLYCISFKSQVWYIPYVEERLALSERHV